jgi:26S proteasome regulatory subunit N10
MGAINEVRSGGKGKFSSSIQIAQLALKHRQNKNQRQRIVAFVGSPLEEDEATLRDLGKKLKKNNVAIDVVSFGEDEVNRARLEALVEAAQGSGDASHLVAIPPSGRMMSDTLLSTAVIMGDDAGPTGAGGAEAGGAGGAGAGGAGGFEFGFNEELDPELALVLRISAEEARAHEEAQRAAAAGGGGSGATPAAANNAAAGAGAGAGATPAAAQAPAAMDLSGDEDQDMLAALALSMAEVGPAPTSAAPAASTASASAPAQAGASTIDAALQDPNYILSLLQGLPGVDTTPAGVDATIQALGKKSEDGKKDDNKKKDDDHLYD